MAQQKLVEFTLFKGFGEVGVAAGQRTTNPVELGVVRRDDGHGDVHRRDRLLDLPAQRQTVELTARTELDVEKHQVVAVAQHQLPGLAAGRGTVHLQTPRQQPHFEIALGDRAVVHDQGARR